jgi:hypothetical protein
MNLATTYNNFLCMLVFGKFKVQFKLADFPLVSGSDLYVVKLIMAFTKLKRKINRTLWIK